MIMKRISGVEVDEFFARQLAEWPMAKTNFRALDAVQVKTVQTGNYAIKVQFNPARIRSSAAKIDAASLKARKCFLCDENRPLEQQWLAWGEEYKVLVNPYPIFPKHLTIACSQHTAQSIIGRMPHMMAMADAMDGYELFYNGPRCGASAPDHMHFQAGNKGFMPWLSELNGADEQLVASTDRARMSIVDHERAAVVIRATDITAGAAMFDMLTSRLPVPAGESEPMLNVLCAKNGDEWIVSAFPRKRHRPTCYDAQGDDNILISPASVDMGGAMAIPLEKDFAKIGAREIKQIFSEVCYSSDEIAKMIKSE